MQKKEKIQLGITLALVIVLALILMANPRMKRQKTVSAVKQGSAEADSAWQEVKSREGQFLSLEQQAKQLIFKRDPFTRIPINLPEGPAPLYLQGIARDGRGFVAIINDQVVQAGNQIEGSTIVDIQADRVILNNGVRDFQLILTIEE